MSLPHPLDERLADVVAERFRILSEPMRLRILDALRDRPLTVGALADMLGSSQQNVSKHLGLMHAAGLTDREKQGNCVAYRVADASVFELCEHVCGGIERQVQDLDALLKGVAR